MLRLPGGPPAEAAHLGDLGGLPRHRALAVLDLPGGATGPAAPADPVGPAGGCCDRLVDAVEAVREQLGLPVVDLLAHSAGADLALR
ncbi:hypothetical protein [Kineococcus sp. SYSU DK006]|uniref:hypothetical protein n=1 Tax=Kineococcus sp. SYSU DK006 TaxID=3383127 RepID=UPI003D7CD2C3